jgi:nucleoside-diphosphate-sugar epimerase
VARILIVGCGCRGQELARALVADGHAVRGTTRDRARLQPIADTAAEPVLADPDRVGTLVAALDAVAIVVWLLGRATDDVEALHGPRLRALLEKLVDTTVRGFAYERAGEEVGAAVREAHETWRIPVAEITGDGWPEPGRRAVKALLDSARTR